METKGVMTATQSSATAATTKPFPFLDLKAQFAPIRQEVMEAVTRVMESQYFILGPEVAGLEEEIAAYIGCKHAISCASGSDALMLALMALDIEPGDEVITVPFTFFATGGAIARLHAKPVFVDIDPVTFNMDPAQIEKAITPRTKAIMPVHLFGLCADMDAINQVADRHGIPVIEDAAQAIGSRYKGKQAGTLGAMGCFSFFPSKNLGGGGDGGLVTTNDPKLAEKLKLLRVHGSRSRYSYELLGVNSRLDALQAAILRVKLPHLDTWAEGRRRNADLYRTKFQAAGVQQVVVPTEPPQYFHVYNQFTVRVPQREALQKHFQAAGVPSEIYYPYPLHLQPAFACLGHKDGDLPQCEKACHEVLSLPIYPELTEDRINQVVNAAAEFFGTK